MSNSSEKYLLLALSGGLIVSLTSIAPFAGLSALAATPQQVQEAQQRAQQAQQQAQQRQQQMQQEMQQRQQEAQQRQQQMQQQAQQRQQQMQQEAQQRQQEAQQRQQQMQQAQQQRQQQAQQELQQRQQQAQQMRQQQEQARQQQEQEMRQAAQQRQQQEQNLRQQELQARQQQQQNIRQQQDQNRQQQEQQVRQQAEFARQQGEQNRQQWEQNRQMQDQARQRAEAFRQAHPNNANSFIPDRNGQPILNRAERPPALRGQRLPLSKAIAMPMLARNASADDRMHSQEVERNLQAHLIAVSKANRPGNYHEMRDFAREQYFNNYQATIANQQYIINRQNTFINALQQNQWPTWYQPQPNYQFCNGFTFGNSLQCDLNWLRWGWHPYYGPAPDGFICQRDYMPTPWIFIPAYGAWRQPGVNAYSPYGPPYDYTGPITVEVFEPRQINVSGPFGYGMPSQVINAVYFYNAYYFPEAGRYGYMNQYGNWIWLNLDPGSY